MTNQPPPDLQPVKQLAVNLGEIGTAVAVAIEDAVAQLLPEDHDELLASAYRIRLCNDRGNAWIAEDLLIKATGEAFNGHGRFWSCNQKLCQHCLAKQTRRNRRILKSRIEKQRRFAGLDAAKLTAWKNGRRGIKKPPLSSPPTRRGKEIRKAWNQGANNQPRPKLSKPGLLTGEYWKFVTFTIPNYGLPILTARAIENYAWALFRKRKWFQDHIIGGCRSEEFELTKTGWHYHLHCIFRSKYIWWAEMRMEWTKCVQTSFQTLLGKTIHVQTKDEKLFVRDEEVWNQAGAIKEVAKYITKSENWRKLDGAELLDVVRISRWPRMFEFFGSFRSELCDDSEGVALEAPDKTETDKTILDTKKISDGNPDKTGWRNDLKRAQTLSEYLSKLRWQVENTREVRKELLKQHHPVARFWCFRSELHRNAPNTKKFADKIWYERQIEQEKPDAVQFIGLRDLRRPPRQQQLV